MQMLLNITEVYRVDTEEEAKALIESAKQDSSFDLVKYSSEFKEKKSKGEVISSGYCLKLVKNYENFWYDVE